VNITIATAGGELVGQPTSAVTAAATFKYGPAPDFVLGAPKVSKHGTMTFTLTAPSGGTFTGTGSTRLPHKAGAKGKKITYGKGRTTAGSSGPVKLIIKPSRKARKALAKGEKLKVHVTVTFKSTQGSTISHQRTVKVG
jgi:hypothetical protein